MEQGAPAAHRGGPRTAMSANRSQHSTQIPANHGKPWDGKVMGTKVSYPREGDLCRNPAKAFRGARRNRLTEPASTIYVSPAAGKNGTPSERAVRKANRG